MVDLIGNKVLERAPRGSVPKWAERYGYSERAVKKFLDLGRKVGEMPPFDHPEKMEDWAGRHIRNVTRRFQAGVQQALGGESVESEKGGGAGEAEPMDLPEVHESEMGMEMQLSGYQREFAMLAKLRDQALRAGDFSRANNYFDQQQKVSSEIRQLERLLPTVLEQRGDYQRTAAVRTATIEFLTVLKRTLLGRDSKASSRLRAAKSDAELRDAWRAEINACFREVCSTGFGENLILE
jgi:hypothetical protein